MIIDCRKRILNGVKVPEDLWSIINEEINCAEEGAKNSDNQSP
jgi:hypothetical protein